jgi:hypothetical protein
VPAKMEAEEPMVLEDGNQATSEDILRKLGTCYSELCHSETVIVNCRHEL